MLHLINVPEINARLKLTQILTIHVNFMEH